MSSVKGSSSSQRVSHAQQTQPQAQPAQRGQRAQPQAQHARRAPQAQATTAPRVQQRFATVKLNGWSNRSPLTPIRTGETFTLQHYGDGRVYVYKFVQIDGDAVKAIRIGTVDTQPQQSQQESATGEGEDKTSG